MVLDLRKRESRLIFSIFRAVRIKIVRAPCWKEWTRSDLP